MQQLQWQIQSVKKEATDTLQAALGINGTLCTLLINRGVDDFEKARDFFRPNLEQLHSPWLMKDMHKAVDRLIKAFTANEKILVYGDYDVDGTTAVALVFSLLKKLVPEVPIDFYIPHRYREGYGVSMAGIDFATTGSYSLIVCLDCGIKSVELITEAKQRNIDFIVCDHHLPGNILPPAVAILNAKQGDCPYPYKELCGCGIGFKLMCALAEKMGQSQDIVLSHIGLVAIAIAADIVPMTGENRILAYFGLMQINEKPLPGIAALLKLATVTHKLSITNVVFVIAPRINAAGRMDDAKKAVQLFIEEDAEKAMVFAEALHVDNTDRKETDKSITEEALEIISADESYAHQRSTVLYRQHWHKGVVGIVASRVIEHHYKPTIVLTLSNGVVTGSARSVAGFNLYEAIYQCREYLTAYGGHFAAAGLSMLPENVTAFRALFEKVVSSTIKADSLHAKLMIDAVLPFKDINETFYNIISQMEPFGPENLRPVFISEGVVNTGYCKVVKEKHIKFSVKQHDTIFSGIGFNMFEKYEIIESGHPFDIVYSLDENEWNGNKNIQLKVIDIRTSLSA